MTSNWLCFLNGKAAVIAQVVVLAGATGCALLVSPDAKRGDQHLAAGHWEEASLAYKQALKDDPFDPSLQSKYVLARERAAAMYEERVGRRAETLSTAEFAALTDFLAGAAGGGSQ